MNANRRLLLVSYHFGPGCDTGGFRWNAMVRHLSGAGWEVDVLTAARPGREHPYDLDPGVRVYPVEVPTLLGDAIAAGGRLKRGLLGGRRALASAPDKADALPPGPPALGEPPRHGLGHRLYSRAMANLSSAARWSADGGWARRASRLGLALAAQRPPTVVAVSSPPHQTHLAGARLAGTLRVPYLADFRDPWIFGELDAVQSTLIDRRCGAWAQRRTFQAAALAVFNTDWAAEAASARDPSLSGRSATVPNGYDPRDGIDLPDPDAFRIAFVGWLYEFMDPEPVLAACGRLRAREGLDTLRVQFVGTDPAPGGVSLLTRARRHGLESCFEHHPRVSREAAQRVQDRAAVRVVFDYPGPLRVPMKFYDAVQGYGDLLLVGRASSALADAAAKVGMTVCPPDHTGAMDAVLDRALARWRGRAYGAPVDARGVFARHHTSRRMLELLEGLAASARVSHGPANSLSPDSSERNFMK